MDTTYNLTFEQVVSASARLYRESLTRLPGDITETLKGALKKEKNIRAKEILKTLMNSALTSREKGQYLCTDPGLPFFYLKIGGLVTFDFDIEEAVKEGIAKLGDESYPPFFPIATDPVNRNRSYVGEKVPVVTYDIIPHSHRVEMICIPKGSGGQQYSRVEMFGVVGFETVKEFVVETVQTASGKACPPLVVGIGIGGTFETVTKLSGEALIRDIRKRNGRPEIGRLELEVLHELNALNIGPMGLGGNTTVIGVNVEIGGTTSVLTPVAVNVCCWARRMTRENIFVRGHS